MNSSNGVKPELGQQDGTDGLFSPLSALFSQVILYIMH